MELEHKDLIHDDHSFKVNPKPGPSSSSPLSFSQQQEFSIPFLNVKRTNRIAFYISLISFLSLTIIFAVLAGQYSANAYIIVGIIVSVIGMFVSMIRISISVLGFVPSTTKFLRTMIFLWECYFGITAILLFIQNISVVGIVVVLFFTMSLITVIQIQMRYGKEFSVTAKQIFGNDIEDDDDDEDDVIVIDKDKKHPFSNF